MGEPLTGRQGLLVFDDMHQHHSMMTSISLRVRVFVWLLSVQFNIHLKDVKWQPTRRQKSTAAVAAFQTYEHARHTYTKF